MIKSFQPNIIVCHSLANTLWFWYASKNSYKVDKLYLVAMPSLETKENTISSFFPAPLPQSLHAKEAIFVASTDDKWCSIDEVDTIAKKYNAQLKILKNAGHINSDSGYGDWEWIFKEFDLKRECKE